MLNVTIDGKKIEVEEGTTILEAANRVGIRIPTLCHHPMLESPGSCRVCIVEMRRGKRAKIVTACNYPVRDDGIEVLTRSERVLRDRKVVVELLLARCPEAQVVRELADELGIKDTPYPKQEGENCLLCGRCVAVCNDVVGAGAIGYSERGIFLKTRTPVVVYTSACIGCGACTYVCPTGAIQMEADARKRFLKLPGPLRLCRYARMGILDYKICPNSYECFRCEVDQRMEEIFGTHPALALRPAEAKKEEKIGEFVFRPNLFYHRGHVWVRPLNGKVMLGLDDFAKRLVCNVKDISLSSEGSVVNKGDVAWDIVCGKERNAKMLFPFGGRIVDVNPDVINDPSIIQKDPYKRGWVYIMSPGKETYSAGLLAHLHAKEWLRSETDHLHTMMHGKDCLIATDGGYLLEDLPNNLSDIEWNGLVSEFFLQRD